MKVGFAVIREKNRMEKLMNKYIEEIGLSDLDLSESYYYSSLVLCVIDAVYSISVRYSSVEKVVENFCDFAGIERYRKDKTRFPDETNQFRISEFLKLASNIEPLDFANDVFKNKQRTSTRSGILKAEAVVLFHQVLERHNIQTFQDLESMSDDDLRVLEAEVRNIKGQSSGISYSYFRMLAGDDSEIKPDRMIIRYLTTAMGYNVSIGEAKELIKELRNSIIKEYGLRVTLREIDHSIWRYQRVQANT